MKILFLGYDIHETKLINLLKEQNCFVDHLSTKLIDISNYDLIISFGYKYIIGKKVINQFKNRIINLHISYLPYNRGAHPNFWSFYDETPKGVTIHLMNEKIDNGAILFQRKINFDKNEITFRQTYMRLLFEIEALFIENIDSILSMKWSLKKQSGVGTYHRLKDLPSEFGGWDSIIKDEIKRLKNEK